MHDGAAELVVLNQSAYGSMRPGEVHGFESGKSFIGLGYKKILQQWDIPQGANILDIATGKGEAADFLRGLFQANVLQTDLSLYPLQLQKKDTHKDALFVAHAVRQPFPNHVFDAVHMKDAFVHVQDKYAFFQEMKRLLKPKGKLLIVTQLQKEDTVFLHYAQKENEKKFSSMPLPFYGIEDYAKLVTFIQNNKMMYEENRIVSISPPYFSWRWSDLQEVSAQAGFVVNRSKGIPFRWKPDKGEPDWHHAPRVVVEFESTVDTRA
jgi:SAM-dependent methyltransferase